MYNNKTHLMHYIVVFTVDTADHLETGLKCTCNVISSHTAGELCKNNKYICCYDDCVCIIEGNMYVCYSY